MKVLPVTRYRSVRYPIISTALENPRMLQHIPSRWRKNHAILLTLSATGLIASTVWAQERGVLAGSPAVFSYLSENEAIKIARTEAKRAGLSFVSKGRHFPIKIHGKDGKVVKTFQYLIDEINPKTGVGFEYVTFADCRKVYGNNTLMSTTDLANEVKKSLKAVKNGTRIKVSSQESILDDKEQATHVRKELRSFFKWLKGQGVI